MGKEMVVRMRNSSLFSLIWSVGADQWPNEQTDVDQVMWLGSTWFLSSEYFHVRDSDCFVHLLQFFYFSHSSLHRICQYEVCIFLFTPVLLIQVFFLQFLQWRQIKSRQQKMADMSVIESCTQSPIDLALVVQRSHNAIHWINLYLLDSIICPLYNWALD